MKKHPATTKNFVAANPKLLAQWHPTKNLPLMPDQVVAGTNKKLWWQCAQGHAWQAAGSARVLGSGCPYCSNNFISKTNNLAATHPELAKQWHPIKNLPLTTALVFAGTVKKLWWQCDKGHEWAATGNNRVAGNKCPACGNRRVSKTNNLAATHPDLAKQWHPIKNSPLTADQVFAGTRKSLWWQCDKGHAWQAAGNDRLRGNGCPYCSNQRVSKTNNLAATHPYLAKQWHPIRNLPLTSDQVVAGTNKSLWWQCDKGHEWQVAGNTRVKGNGCPDCGNKIVSKTNNLTATHSELTKQWHPTRNLPLTADQVVAGTSRKLWWQCDKGHEWQATGNNRAQGSGCPYCSNKFISKTNNLAAIHPDLAKQWHPIKNLPLTPDQVVPGTDKKLWWQCDNGHAWQAAGNDRVSGKGCPYCSNRRVSKTNNLAATHPDLAKQWHPTRNLPLTADQIVAGTRKKLWWQCDNGHEWQATGDNRVRGTSCTRCNQGWSIVTIRTFVESLLPQLSSFTPAELDTLFQQTGLLAYGGQGRVFVKALSTGQFPKEDLEKFVAGEDSLVEQLLLDEDGPKATSLIDWSRQLEGDTPTGSGVASVEEVAFERDLPRVTTTQALAAVSSAAKIIGSADEEAVEFLIASAVAKMWRHAFRGSEDAGSGVGVGEQEALDQARAYLNANGSEINPGGDYGSVAATRFLAQYQRAQDLPLPAGYNFRAQAWLLGNAAPITLPNLMQRLCAAQTLALRRYGNWSGTGAGKTLAALLATRVADAGLTVVCCPNSVVDGWATKIKEAFPQSVVQTKTWTPQWPTKDAGRYLILNYEQFQQPETPACLGAFLRNEQPDFVIIDEIHQAKVRRVQDESLRRQYVKVLVGEATKKKPDLYVLAMSATPVINNLQEGKSLIELVSGLTHDDLETKATVPNCMAVYRKLVTSGLRWLPEYDLEWEPHDPRVYVDCTAQVPVIRALATNGTPLALETILTEARLPLIRETLRKWGAEDPSGSPRTLLYTYYISGIEKLLREALVTDGWRVGSYTGEDKSGLQSFLAGKLDVLIATSAIGTGVDHLQDNCHRMIINTLPWTSADFEQLKGRLFRQGQTSIDKKIQLLIPLTQGTVDGKHWSYCASRWERIAWKKSVADSAVDGVVPEEHWRTEAQAYEDAMAWLRRLSDGELNVIERAPLQTQLPSETPASLRAPRKYNDFSEMNRHWDTTSSAKTHARLVSNPAEWVEYHELYREARKDWAVVPYEAFITWARLRESQALVIADMGAGEAKVAAALSDIHTVHSIDHVAANNDVLAEDMAHTALDAESVDVVLFSLSLMGHNVKDYLHEANRILRLDGTLHIYEASSRFSDLPTFVRSLELFGFKVFAPEDVWKFTHIEAKKDREPAPNADLKF